MAVMRWLALLALLFPAVALAQPGPPPGGASLANPTATAGPAAVNGSATTAMRSDAAPAVQKGSASVFGIMECDNSTVTCPGGVLSSVGGAATSITPGTTTIIGATAPCAITNITSTTMGCLAYGTTGASTLVETSGAGFISPAILNIGIGSGEITSGTTGYLLYNNAGVPGNETIASILTAGNGISITGTTNATITASSPVRTVTTSPTIGSGDLGGQINMNVSGGGTLTVPATSTFVANSTVSVVNYSASTAAVSTTPTINAGGGCVTATGIPSGDTWQMLSNGTSIECFQTVSSGGGTNVLTGAGAGTSGYPQPQTMSNGATVTPANPVGAFTFYTLAQAHGTNNAIAVPATANPNQQVTFTLTQDSTGGSTITFAAGYTFLSGTPSFNTAANAVNVVGCYVTSATGPTLSCSFYAPTVPTMASTGFSAILDSPAGTPTLSNTPSGVTLWAPSNSGTNEIYTSCIAAPATPYTVVARLGLNFDFSSTTDEWGGITWRKAGAANVEPITLNGLIVSSVTTLELGSNNFTNASTFAGTTESATNPIFAMYDFTEMLHNDGTNISVSFGGGDTEGSTSIAGVYYTKSIASSFLGAGNFNDICLFLDAKGANSSVTLKSFKILSQ
jgi:hypothetical protein